MVECTLSITHCLRLNLQLHTIDLVRTGRISSFCTVAWQLVRFQLTRRIARSLGDSWASCNNNVRVRSYQMRTFQSTYRWYACSRTFLCSSVVRWRSYIRCAARCCAGKNASCVLQCSICVNATIEIHWVTVHSAATHGAATRGAEYVWTSPYAELRISNLCKRTTWPSSWDILCQINCHLCSILLRCRPTGVTPLVFVNQRNRYEIIIINITIVICSYTMYVWRLKKSVFSLVPRLSTRHCPYLLLSAVLRRRCCWARLQQAPVDRFLLPAGRSAANPPATSINGTERRTNGRSTVS